MASSGSDPIHIPLPRCPSRAAPGIANLDTMPEQVQSWYCQERQRSQSSIQGGYHTLPSAELQSSNVDSAYVTGPMRHSSDGPPVCQKRDPEDPAARLAPAKPARGLGMTCPFENCPRMFRAPCNWRKHKNSHWPTKYGCPYCHLVPSGPDNACTLCKMHIQNPEAAASHIFDCVTKDADFMLRIRDQRRGWWQKQGDLWIT